MSRSEDTFERYRPKYPLPEELQQLDRTESICKFCGVSYLIHNEIKKLEDDLAAATKEASRFRAAAEESAQLRQHNASLEEQNKHLKEMLMDVEEKFRITVNDKKDLQIRLDDISAEHSCCVKEISALKTSLGQERQRHQGVHEKAHCLSRYLRLTRDEMSNTKQVLLSALNKCHEEHETMAHSVNSYLAAYARTAQQKESNRREEVIEKERALKKLEDVHNQHLVRIEYLEKEIENRIREKQQIAEERSSLQLQLDEATFKNEDMQKRLLFIESEMQNTEANKHANSKVIEESQQQIDRLKKDRDKLTLTAEQHIKTIENLQTKIGYLEKTCQEHLKKQDENTALHSHTVGEMENLRFELARQKVEIDELKNEREKLIFSHQNRMQQLKESYQQKMAESPEWKARLESALNAAEARRIEDLQRTEQRLIEEFRVELEIERQKQRQLVENARKEARSTEEITKLRHQMEDLQNRHAMEKESLQAKFDDVTRKLHLEIAERTKSQTALAEMKRQMNEQMNARESEQVDKLRHDVQQLLSIKNEMHNKVQQMSITLQERNDEIRVLQDTVRRECEERYELLEALNEAKEHLHPSGPVPMPVPSSSTSSNSHDPSGPPPPPYPVRNSSIFPALGNAWTTNSTQNPLPSRLNNPNLPPSGKPPGSVPSAVLLESATSRGGLSLGSLPGGNLSHRGSLPGASNAGGTATLLNSGRTVSRGSSTSSNVSHQSAPVMGNGSMVTSGTDPLSGLRQTQQLQKHEAHKRRLAAILSQKVAH